MSIYTAETRAESRGEDSVQMSVVLRPPVHDTSLYENVLGGFNDNSSEAGVQTIDPRSEFEGEATLITIVDVREGAARRVAEAVGTIISMHASGK